MMKPNGVSKGASGLATERLISASVWRRAILELYTGAVNCPPLVIPHEIDLMRHLGVDARGGRCNGVAGMYVGGMESSKGAALQNHLLRLRQAQRTPYHTDTPLHGASEVQAANPIKHELV